MAGELELYDVHTNVTYGDAMLFKAIDNHNDTCLSYQDLASIKKTSIPILLKLRLAPSEIGSMNRTEVQIVVNISLLTYILSIGKH